MIETIDGKMRIEIKITEFPKGATDSSRDRKKFYINADGVLVSVSVKPKQWNQFLKAQSDFPQWTATIAGNMGKRNAGGFVLENPGIQIHEKKPKADTSEN